MKKFNLLKASSLILASYFIVGFSSCSDSQNQVKDSFSKIYYEEIELTKLLQDNLNMEIYLANSRYLQDSINKFKITYPKIYIFNISRTYHEYQIYVYDKDNYINVGYISKNGNEITLEYFVYENGYKKNIKHTSIFKFSFKLKKYYEEITYEDLETNYGFKEYSEYNAKSLIYNENKSIFEIILSDNEQYFIKFRYDLINNIEISLNEVEYNILKNSLVEKYKHNNLAFFIKDNEKLLFDILKRSESNSVYFEYDSIFETLEVLCNKSRIRIK